MKRWLRSTPIRPRHWKISGMKSIRCELLCIILIWGFHASCEAGLVVMNSCEGGAVQPKPECRRKSFASAR